MLLLVRKSDVRFRPMMLGMVADLRRDERLYMSASRARARRRTPSSLQNTTAPNLGVLVRDLHHEGIGRPSRLASGVLLGGLGALVIVGGKLAAPICRRTSSKRRSLILLMGVGSGITYGRRDGLPPRAFAPESAAWLTALNLIGSAGRHRPLSCSSGSARQGSGLGRAAPSAATVRGGWPYNGAVQMAIPYWLFARGPARTFFAARSGNHHTDRAAVESALGPTS